MNIPVHIHKWKGLVFPESWGDDYKKAIEQFIEGHYSSLNLERLQNSDVYSIKLNDSDRLLLTFREVNGESYIHFIEVINNHDYQKSRFLKSGVLKHFLNKTDEDFKSFVINAESFKPDSGDALPKVRRQGNDKFELKYIPVHYFNGLFLRLSEEQEECINLRLDSMPAMFSGGAGSGKTSTAFMLLKSLVQELSHNEKILFIAKNEQLVETLAQLWNALPELTEEQKQRVSFKCYDDVVASLNYDFTCGRRIVGEDEFLIWLGKNERKYHDKGAKIYEEFGYISFYSNKEEYVNLQDRKDHFDQETRAQLWDLFQQYTLYLNDNQAYDPVFLKLNEHGLYDFVIADESQDFSNDALNNILNHLAKNNKALFCFDNRQSLQYAKSRKLFIQDLLFKNNRNLKDILDIQLTAVYRFCSQQLFNLANGFQLLRNYALGGVIEKGEKPIRLHKDSITQQDGVVWIKEALNDSQIRLLQEKARHAEFAVITNDKNDPIVKKIAAANTLTPAEAKGLEFEEVFYHSPVSDELAPLSEQLKNVKIEQLVNLSNQPKSNELANKFHTICSEIYTGFTRAKKTTIIYQIISHPIAALCHLLEVLIFDNNPRANKKLEDTKKERVNSEEVRLDHWEEIAKTYYHRKNMIALRDVFDSHLKNRKKETPEAKYYLNFDSYLAYIASSQKRPNKPKTNSQPQTAVKSSSAHKNYVQPKLGDSLRNLLLKFPADQLLKILFYHAHPERKNYWDNFEYTATEMDKKLIYQTIKEIHEKFSDRLLLSSINNEQSHFEYIASLPSGAQFLALLMEHKRLNNVEFYLGSLMNKFMPFSLLTKNNWDTMKSGLLVQLCKSNEGIKLLKEILYQPSIMTITRMEDENKNDLMHWALINEELELALCLLEKNKNGHFLLRKNNDKKSVLSLAEELFEKNNHDSCANNKSRLIYFMLAFYCGNLLLEIYNKSSDWYESVNGHLNDQAFYKCLSMVDNYGNNMLQVLMAAKKNEELILTILNHSNIVNCLSLLSNINQQNETLLDTAKKYQLSAVIDVIQQLKKTYGQKNDPELAALNLLSSLNSKEMQSTNEAIIHHQEVPNYSEIKGLTRSIKKFLIEDPKTFPSPTAQQNLQGFFNLSVEQIIHQLFYIKVEVYDNVWGLIISNSDRTQFVKSYLKEHGIFTKLSYQFLNNSAYHRSHFENIASTSAGMFFLYLLLDELVEQKFTVDLTPVAKKILGIHAQWEEIKTHPFLLRQNEECKKRKYIRCNLLAILFNFPEFHRAAKRQDEDGNNLLHWAILNKEWELVQVLWPLFISAHHFELQKNTQGKSIAQLICEQWQNLNTAVAQTEVSQVIKRLKTNSRSVIGRALDNFKETKDKDEKNALSKFIGLFLQDKYLCELAKSADMYGNTLLHDLISTKVTAWIRKMIGHDNFCFDDMHIKNKNHETPYHLAQQCQLSGVIDKIEKKKTSAQTTFFSSPTVAKRNKSHGFKEGVYSGEIRQNMK